MAEDLILIFEFHFKLVGYCVNMLVLFFSFIFAKINARSVG